MPSINWPRPGLQSYERGRRQHPSRNLLQLKLDRRTDLSELVEQILGMGDGGGEFSSFGETGSEQTGDLLDQSFRGQESVVLLGELLDELLIFVEPGSRDQR